MAKLSKELIRKLRQAKNIDDVKHILQETVKMEPRVTLPMKSIGTCMDPQPDFRRLAAESPPQGE